MNTPKSVLGVLPVCWVGFANPTQVEASNGGALRAVCWVCWVCTCARAYACIRRGAEQTATAHVKTLYARTVKPSTPNTLNTDALKVLIYKGFKCVGFVLGWAFCVGLLVLVGVGQ